MDEIMQCFQAFLAAKKDRDLTALLERALQVSWKSAPSTALPAFMEGRLCDTSQPLSALHFVFASCFLLLSTFPSRRLRALRQRLAAMRACAQQPEDPAGLGLLARRQALQLHPPAHAGMGERQRPRLPGQAPRVRLRPHLARKDAAEGHSAAGVCLAGPGRHGSPLG